MAPEKHSGDLSHTRVARLLASLLACSLTLCGCQLGHLWVSPRRVVNQAAAFVAQRAQAPALVPGASLPGFGTMRLAIQWPAGPGRDLRGHRAQLIPDSTARIEIAIRAGGTTVGFASVSRPQGQVLTIVTVQLRAALNLTVEAKAFPSGGDSGTPIAQATRAGVNIFSSVETPVGLTMTSLYAPAIAGLSSAFVLVGGTLTLSGSNLAPGWQATGPTVLFTGSGASVSVSPQAGSQSDTSLSVTVPAGARNGPITVVTDGVESGPASFLLGGTLTVSAAGQIPASTTAYTASVTMGGAPVASIAETASTSAPFEVVVPQVTNLTAYLEAYPASNRPPSSGGAHATGSMAVEMSDLATKSSAVQLVALYRPEISTLDPSSAATGSAVTITGSNFRPAWVGGSPPRVFFAGSSGNVEAAVESATDASISVTVPSGAANGALTVLQDGISSEAVTFFVGAPPLPGSVQ